MSDAEQLQQARELITQKKYQEARAILKSMDNPTAKAWLTKLDTITSPPSQRRRSVLPWALLSSLSLVVNVVLIVVLIIRAQTPPPEPLVQLMVVTTEVERVITVIPTALPTDVPTIQPTTTVPPAPTAAPTTASLSSIPTRVVDSGDWVFFSETSRLDNSTTAVVSLDAAEPVTTWLSQTTPSLVVGCANNGALVFVIANTQLDSDYQTDTISVRLRYDSDAVRSLRMDVNDDNDTMYFQNTQQTIRDLLAHDQMLFEFTPFNAGPDDTYFDLRGFDQALEQLRPYCGGYID